MSSDLKKLVSEIETILAERCGSLDAPARGDFEMQLESLKRAIDAAEAAELRRLTFDALNVVAALLSIITNVTTLLH